MTYQQNSNITDSNDTQILCYCFSRRIIMLTKFYKECQYIKLKQKQNLTSTWNCCGDSWTHICSVLILQPPSYPWSMAVRNTSQKPLVQGIHTIPLKFTPQILHTLSSCHLPQCVYKMQGTIVFIISRIWVFWRVFTLRSVFNFQHQTLLQKPWTHFSLLNSWEVAAGETWFFGSY